MLLLCLVAVAQKGKWMRSRKMQTKHDIDAFYIVELRQSRCQFAVYVMQYSPIHNRIGSCRQFCLFFIFYFISTLCWHDTPYILSMRGRKIVHQTVSLVILMSAKREISTTDVAAFKYCALPGNSIERREKRTWFQTIKNEIPPTRKHNESTHKNRKSPQRVVHQRTPMKCSIETDSILGFSSHSSNFNATEWMNCGYGFCCVIVFESVCLCNGNGTVAHSTANTCLAMSVDS